jgi:uncharacterized membrane protein
MRSMAATETPPSSRPLAGVLWMLLTGVCFVAVTAIVKHVGDRIPPAESAFLRYLLGLILMVPILRRAFTYRIDRGAMRLFALRGAAHGIGVMLWFYAMTQISIAEVTAMNYLSPVYVTIGAALFLGERLALRRIAAIVLALVGALVILRPGLRELSPGHLAMLGTAIVFAASYLIAKIMADRLPPEVVVGWLSLTVTIVLAPLRGARLGLADMDRAWLADARRVLRHRGALHDDAGAARGADHGDPAGDLSAAGLGHAARSSGLRRGDRWLGAAWRHDDPCRGQLHHLARGGAAPPRRDPARPRHQALSAAARAFTG